MSEVPVWTCDIAEIKDESHLEHLTVGDRFRLNCHGDIAVPWTADLPVVKMPKPEQDFTLAVLSAERLDPQAVQLTVTGYRPGEHAPEYVRILQGERGFEFEKPKWKIESVIKPGEGPPKPYPASGVHAVPAPWWLQWTFWALVIALVAAIGRQIWRWVKRRRFRRELKRHQTALAPVRQFYRDARGLRRRLNEDPAPDAPTRVGADLNRDFRLMLMRKYEAPALTLSNAKLVKDIRRRHRAVDVVVADALKKVLRELTRAGERQALTHADVDQLIRMAVDVAESLERGGR